MQLILDYDIDEAKLGISNIPHYMKIKNTSDLEALIVRNMRERLPSQYPIVITRRQDIKDKYADRNYPIFLENEIHGFTDIYRISEIYKNKGYKSILEIRISYLFIFVALAIGSVIYLNSAYIVSYIQSSASKFVFGFVLFIALNAMLYFIKLRLLFIYGIIESVIALLTAYYTIANKVVNDMYYSILLSFAMAYFVIRGIENIRKGFNDIRIPQKSKKV